MEKINQILCILDNQIPLEKVLPKKLFGSTFLKVEKKLK
jgi:hypothetical protein